MKLIAVLAAVIATLCISSPSPVAAQQQPSTPTANPAQPTSQSTTQPRQPQLGQFPLGLQPQLSPSLYGPSGQLTPQNGVLMQCRQTVPSTQLDVQELQQNMLPSTPSGRCLLACAAQQLGFAQPNYPLEEQGASALTATLFPSRGFDPSFQNGVMIAVNQCLAQQQGALVPQLAQAANRNAFNPFNPAQQQYNPLNPLQFGR